VVKVAGMVAMVGGAGTGLEIADGGAGEKGNGDLGVGVAGTLFISHEASGGR